MLHPGAPGDENRSVGGAQIRVRNLVARGDGTSLGDWIREEEQMRTLIKDLRYGIRMLVKSPGFTIVAVLSLALGIGVNTTVFSLLDAVMLRSLPVQHPEQIVDIATFVIGIRRCGEDHWIRI